MDVSNLHKSTTCESYIEKAWPVIEQKTIGKGQEWSIEVLYNKLVFITEGDVSISYKDVPDDALTKGNIALFPIGHKIDFYAKKDTSITIFRLLHKIDFCEHFSHKQLSYKEILKDILSDPSCPEKTNQQSDAECISDTCLKMNEFLWSYLDNLNKYIAGGMKCSGFFELKLKELFFLLQAYYTKTKLRLFFKPFIFCDQEFTSIVMSNMNKVKTVKELALLTNYSISGFEKRFRRVFQTSAGSWIKKQRSINIYHEISSGEVPFKHISFKNGFSSLSHFNNYCKLHFGLTPGEIRKKGTIANANIAFK